MDYKRINISNIEQINAINIKILFLIFYKSH